ncbi:TolC family protein [bacterium]|nr:TolC family protein [bacterium]MBU1753716.1 TolC family protein [bacterium]
MKVFTKITKVAPLFVATFLVSILVSTGWAGITPLTLEQGIQIALDNNHGLQAASKSVTSAKEGIVEARAGFLPTMRLESSCIKLDEAPSFGVMTMGDDVIYDAKGVVTQPLFTGGKLSSAYKLALSNYNLAEYGYERVQNELIFGVKGAYLCILKALKFQQVAKDAVKQVEAHLRIVRNLYDAGINAKVDVLKCEVQLSTVRQNLIKAENMVSMAKAGFNQLLARELDTGVEVIDILEVTPCKINLDDCIKEAANSRPELKQMKAAIEMLRQMVTIAESDNYPSVAGIGNYDYQKGRQSEIEWKGSWLAGIMVNFTLWDGNARKSRINQAEANLEAVYAQQLNLSDGIALEVKQAYLSLSEAEKNIEVAHGAIGQAEEGLRITEEMYKEGCATNTDVLDSQTMLTQVKTNYYQALYDYNLARARLQKAVGGR